MRIRLLCAALCLFALLCLTGTAMAREPREITTVPYESLPEPVDGQHHYLLLCVDRWDINSSILSLHKKAMDSFVRNNSANTDGIVLLTLDSKAHRIMLTSIIRDALVWRPDPEVEGKFNFGRINYIAQCNDPETLCRVISEHIGVKIEKYILFSMNQIGAIIDALGGVDIDITAAEATYLDAYSITRPVPHTEPAIVKGRAGTYHFNGHGAVIYMRIRKVGGGGDFMRTQRVRTVLGLLADECREISMDAATSLANTIFENNVMSNASLEDVVQAAGYAYALRDCTIEELRLPTDEAALGGITWSGMAAQEVDWEKCRASMAYYLENSFVVMDEFDSKEFNDLSGADDLSQFGFD